MTGATMEESVATTLTTPQTTAVIPDQPMLIGGEWVPALDGSWSDVVSPGHRGTILARVPVGGVADADRAVKAARAAFPGWRPLERAALRGGLIVTSARIAWRLAAVTDVIVETPRAKTLVLDVPGWPGHVAGQHVDVRLTAEDGYQAQRSYSIASAPEDATLALTVERLEDGEVSPYLTDELGPGDELELRGPIGGYFVWRSQDGGPLLLVAGGSGLVPPWTVRHRAAHSSTVDTRLLLSARSGADVLYRDELARLAAGDGLAVHQTFTREPPAGWSGFARRVDADVLSHVGPAPSQRPRIFIRRPTALSSEPPTCSST